VEEKPLEPLRLFRTDKLAVQDEERYSFSMAHKEWDRLKGRLQKRPKPKQWAATVAWLLIGVAIQNVVATLIWHVTGDTETHAWVTPLLVLFTVVCAGVGVGFLQMNRTIKESETYSIETFCEDVDAIAARFAKEPS
jgi:hypothetical protein